MAAISVAVRVAANGSIPTVMTNWMTARVASDAIGTGSPFTVTNAANERRESDIRRGGALSNRQRQRRSRRLPRYASACLGMRRPRRLDRSLALHRRATVTVFPRCGHPLAGLRCGSLPRRKRLVQFRRRVQRTDSPSRQLCRWPPGSSMLRPPTVT